MWWNKPVAIELPVPTTRTNYPYGLCIETEAGVFLIRSKVRYRIPTVRILDSWRLDVLQSTEAAAKHFIIAGKLGFRDGTLINNMADGKIYLVSQNKKRLIASPDVFEAYGLDSEKVLVVSDKEANIHADGEVLG